MNFKFALPATLLIASVSGAMAQKANAPFVRIGNSVSTFGEFDRMYSQNKEVALTPMTEAEYADLFINYKLKVAEARALGLDTLKSYKDECRYYVDDLSKPYFTDTTAFPRLLAREKSRLGEEVKAEHVLISVRPNASPADTLAAYNKAVKARARVLAGEDFAKVAKECSEDPSARQNSGDLGYFSALQMVSQFEDVAYSLKVGENSDVFRTRFGYHFMHLSDRRAAEGQVTVQHIMKFVPANSPDAAAQEAKAKAQIDSLYNLAIADTVDFAELARLNSDDRQSAMHGGTIPWFSRAQILPEFAEAAFALAADGDISKPVRTKAGWHIIRRVGRRTVMPDDEFNRMMANVRQNSEYYRNIDMQSRMEKLAKEYKFTWDKAGRDTLIARALASAKPAKLTEALNDSSIVLATINGEKLLLADAAPFASHWRSDAIPSDNVNKIFCSLVREYESSQLENKYPDFAYRKHEYVEGLLVFEVTQRKVWSVVPDSASIDSLYAAHPMRYAKGGSLDGGIYFCNTPKQAAKVKSLLAKGKADKAEKLAYKVIGGPVNQGDVYDDFIWPIFEVSPYVVVYGLVTNGEAIPLSECRGQVLADYQQIKEREFISALRSKYKPVQLIKL